MNKGYNRECRTCLHLHYFNDNDHIARCTLGIYCECKNFEPKDNLEYLEQQYEKRLAL
jgi:hypothetical protein